MTDRRVPHLLVWPEGLAGREGVLVNFLVGGLILLIVGIIPVVGSWLMVIATVFGLGTILLRVKALREERSA